MVTIDRKQSLIDLFKSINKNKINEILLTQEEELDLVASLMSRSNESFLKAKNLCCKQLSSALSPLVELNNDFDSILYFLELFEFNPTLIKVFLSTNINETDQIAEKFNSNTIKFMGAYFFIKEVSGSIRENIINFSEREGFLFKDDMSLTKKESMFLDSWNLLGRALTDRSDSNFIEDFRKLF